MTTTRKGTACCPRCMRHVSTDYDRYAVHSPTPGSDTYCPMSKQRTPITGMTDRDMMARANLLCSLACQVRDEDPRIVWDYLTTMPAVELQRMLQLALAAIPVDRKLHDVFDWVAELPVAVAS